MKIESLIGTEYIPCLQATNILCTYPIPPLLWSPPMFHLFLQGKFNQILFIQTSYIKKVLILTGAIVIPNADASKGFLYPNLATISGLKHPENSITVPTVIAHRLLEMGVPIILKMVSVYKMTIPMPVSCCKAKSVDVINRARRVPL